MPLVLALPLLYAVTSSHAETASTPGPKFIKDGAAGSQLKQWEISYYAKDYLPICGISMETEGSLYWSNSIECEPAMVAYNSTSVQVGVYDLSGVQSTKAFGIGEQLCMCFGLQHTSEALLDICLLVGMAAEIRERRWSLSGLVAVGIQNPESDSAKMLPQCTSSSTSSAGSHTTGFVTATSSGSVRNSGGSETTSSSQCWLI
jgi:hypothetical protein